MHLALLTAVVTAAALRVPDALGVDAAERAFVSRYAEGVARRVGGGGPGTRFILQQVQANLDEKATLTLGEQRGFPMTAEDIQHTVVDYEAFKYATYVSSGVFPKRYFGYFDRKWDTAALEVTLRTTVHTCVATINARQARLRRPTRVTDAEIAVTFVAEGGAILLRENQAQVNQVHPVLGVGLDDLALGTQRFAELMTELDAALGTQLSTVVEWVETPQGRQPRLTRMLTFPEALEGTALMWIYEKELAADRLLRRDGGVLAQRSVEDQFIVGSLYYNSGILFSDARVDGIREFTTRSYLEALSSSARKKRWPLPLLPAAPLLDHGYPEQATSWSAVYHVLQRYGGYAALMRFTRWFTPGGMFRD